MKKAKSVEDQLSFAGTEEGELLERLTERVERAVDTIQKLRKERDGLRARLQEIEGQIEAAGASADEVASLREEVERYRGERGEIRTRIGRVLDSLASLEEES
ncbi:MAG: cell division protein ZapB [Thermoanaerobaculia bacterium]